MSYICDIYSHHTLKGYDYSEDVLIIQINFSYGLNDSKYVREYKVMDEDRKCYVSNLIIYEINMDKYLELWYSKEEIKESDKYLIMLDLTKEELEKISNNKVVKKYMNELERVNESQEFREYMSAEEDNRKIENSLRKQYIEEGIEEGMNKGIKQGLKSEKKEIAKSMLKKKMNIDLICEITGLEKSEIENIKQ